MERTLEILLEESKRTLLGFNPGIPRENILFKIPPSVTVALGMRRSGKTHALLQKMQWLLAHNVPHSQMTYLNLEDTRLEALTDTQLDNILNHFGKNHYVFLDGLKNAKNHRNITSLNILPFSFREYLLAHEKPHDKTYERLNDYLISGGFPEIITQRAHNRRRILQDYVNTVIFRDIIEPHNISNIKLIKHMIHTLLQKTGQTFSINQFFTLLKTQGLSVGKNTLHDYLDHIENAHLVFTVPLYNKKTNPCKIYAVDTGLINAHTFNSTENLSYLFENIVFLDLKRRNEHITYYLTKNRHEVTFLTRDSTDNLNLYQVAWDSHHAETVKRKLQAMKEAEKELGIKGKIITPLSYLKGLSSL